MALEYFIGSIIVLFVISCLKIVNEYERGVKFTFGKFSSVMDPGLRLVVPIIQSWVRVDIRVKTVDVPGQECVSKDNVSLKVNAVLYYKTMDSKASIIQVEQVSYAVFQLAQTTMRNIIGEFELDEVLSKRDVISKKIQANVDKDTELWGIKVTMIELKDIELPETMKRAMAHQAEAERDRRARVILATGEAQASQKLAEAGKVLSKESASMQLRLFQTLSEIATEKNSTIVLPIPIEMIEFFKNSSRR